MADHLDYVIWSFEHDMWWKPGSWGYTDDLTMAGRYTKADADRIVDNANRYCEEPHEMALLFVDAQRDGRPDNPAHDYGPCCACGGTKRVRNVMMLDKKAPEAGHGWGCFVCHLPMDGALAVVCDGCVESGRKILYACVGDLKGKRRIPIEQLEGAHAHDMAKHAADD